MIEESEVKLVYAGLPSAAKQALGLPTDAAARKAVPIYSGVLKYFPDALAAVAECSKRGNDQHNPGKPLHWDRSKSQDEHDALVRHLMEAGTVDTDGVRHSTKVAWRALAALQKEIELETKKERTPQFAHPITLASLCSYCGQRYGEHTGTQCPAERS